DETGMERRDRVEYVADVNAGDRARRAAQARRICSCKGDDRAAHALLHPARDEAHHALVPALIEQAHTAALHCAGDRVLELPYGAESLLLHARLDGTALLIQRIEPQSECTRTVLLISQQALHADRHIVDAARGIQSRRSPECE